MGTGRGTHRQCRVAGPPRSPERTVQEPGQDQNVRVRLEMLRLTPKSLTQFPLIDPIHINLYHSLDYTNSNGYTSSLMDP